METLGEMESRTTRSTKKSSKPKGQAKTRKYNKTGQGDHKVYKLPPHEAVKIHKLKKRVYAEHNSVKHGIGGIVTLNWDHPPSTLLQSMYGGLVSHVRKRLHARGAPKTYHVYVGKQPIKKNPFTGHHLMLASMGYDKGKNDAILYTVDPPPDTTDTLGLSFDHVVDLAKANVSD